MLPTVIFFSSVVQMLFYLGVMQEIIRKMAWILQHSMQTTAVESLNAAGNIFFSSVNFLIVLYFFFVNLNPVAHLVGLFNNFSSERSPTSNYFIWKLVPGVQWTNRHRKPTGPLNVLSYFD